MAYTPPSSCGFITFDLTTPLLTIPCGELNFNFGAVVDFAIRSADVLIKIIIPKISVFSGFVISSSNVLIKTNVTKSVIDLVWPINSRNITIKTNVNKASIRSPQEYNLPAGKASGISLIWDTPKFADVKEYIPWNTPTDIRNLKEISRNIERSPLNHDVSIPWESLGSINNSTNTISENFNLFQDASYRIKNITLQPTDNKSNIPWGSNLNQADRITHIIYLSPAAKDVHASVRYDTPKELDETINTNWKSPGAKDKRSSVNWGPFSYYTLCKGDRYWVPPPCGVNFEFPNKYELMVNVCQCINFIVDTYSSTDPRCEYQHIHTGIRDNYVPPIINNDFLIYPPSREVYYMLNTVLVEEVVTHKPIEVLAVSATIDRNSWLWSFNITVASKCYLDLIKPIDGVMGHIKININGYIWYCTVEGWSENRSWGSQAWTITGRSPSMMFGEPISQGMTGIVSTGQQGGTVIENIIENAQAPQHWPALLSSWTVNFSDFNAIGGVTTGFVPTQDWHIPGNVISYVNKSEIDVVKDLASAIGAYLQTEPGSNVITVKSMFKHQPWNWNASNNAITWKTLNESQIVEVGRSNTLKPYHQAIHVVGESIGANNDGNADDESNTAIAVEVRREEFSASAASYAQMATSPYITSVKAALERGRTELAQTGEWVNHTLRIGILCPNNTGNSGLFRVGDMLSVMERGTPWFGQVTSVSIATVNAGAGFAVEQSIEVEEYRSE